MRPQILLTIFSLFATGAASAQGSSAQSLISGDQNRVDYLSLTLEEKAEFAGAICAFTEDGDIDGIFEVLHLYNVRLEDIYDDVDCGDAGFTGQSILHMSVLTNVRLLNFVHSITQGLLNAEAADAEFALPDSINATQQFRGAEDVTLLDIFAFFRGLTTNDAVKAKYLEVGEKLIRLGARRSHCWSSDLSTDVEDDALNAGCREVL